MKLATEININVKGKRPIYFSACEEHTSLLKQAAVAVSRPNEKVSK